MESRRKLFLSRRFTSFEELVASVVAWDLDLRQVSRNYFDTTLQQFQVGKILVSHLTCGCFATHAGATPKGMYTVAVPDPGCPEFRYSGQPVDQPAMIVTKAGQEFDLMTRPGYGIFTFSIPESILQDWCEANLVSPFDGLLKSRNGIVPVDWDAVTNTKAAAQALSDLAHRSRKSSTPSSQVHFLESRLLQTIFGSRQPGNQTKKESRAPARRQVFREALDVITSHEHESLSVADLATAVNTTERTLERAFNRELGMPPKKYLLAQRMSGAQKQHWRSSASETSVADIANAWGFWHMGQFAKDYRNFFNELPSETLRKTG